MAHPRPRVLLADDYEPMLQMWRRLLEPTCDVVGALTDGRALLVSAAQLDPDVIVIDVSLSETNGVEACLALTRIVPRARMVIVTAGGDRHLADAAFEAGASAFVLKHAAFDDLPVAVRCAMRGETFCTLFPPGR